MTPINEVCIMFGDSWRIGNYCRVAYSNTEIEKSIKTKLALLLKNYWKDAGGDNEGKLPLHNKLKSEGLIGDELGQFKIEHIFTSFEYISPRKWKGIELDGSITTRGKWN